MQPLCLGFFSSRRETRIEYISRDCSESETTSDTFTALYSPGHHIKSRYVEANVVICKQAALCCCGAVGRYASSRDGPLPTGPPWTPSAHLPGHLLAYGFLGPSPPSASQWEILPSIKAAVAPPPLPSSQLPLG